MSKCKHQQSHYDFLYTVSKKISYWVSLFYRNNSLTRVYLSWYTNFLLLRIFFLHCMDLQPYSHHRFSKISRTLCASINYWIIIVFLQCACSHKHTFTPYPSLSPYSPIDGMTDWKTKTLTACGLEELFFQLCCCVSSWFLAGKRFWFHLLTHLE